MKIDDRQKKEIAKVVGGIGVLMIISGSFNLGFNNLMVGAIDATFPDSVPIQEIASQIPQFVKDLLNSVLPQEVVNSLPFL